ncbi:rhodanese-like domain-containing protein [Sulfurospirillum halorespirans]|uniref:Rhodanese family protein n=1 Tax=Sulfurospirillum halorespirans DSM 13726 TaxID=1193502 RepID=A0A1D7TJQ7_9BACT|nr:rhodanese-like domain-containing protein [Sulfurospirillum halorespirans]AOO65245.1 rhodanese family protein [Sulfurospirillum halorespirans DSM 13726]
MDEPINDEWSEEAMMNLVQTVTKSCEVSGEELHVMLNLRAQKRLDFVLIDIREMYEYSESSIKGTDMLLPTSTIHQHMDELKKLSGKLLIFYCHIGGRTTQMLFILRRMGFSNIAQLSGGIDAFHGEKLKNAPLPKTMK